MCNHRVIELVLGQNKTYVSFPFGKIKYQKNYQKRKKKENKNKDVTTSIIQQKILIKKSISVEKVTLK